MSQTHVEQAARAPKQHGLGPRMLINVGVFAAIYFVVTFGSGMLGLFSPFMEIVGFLVGALINGTVVMLFLAKTPARGAMTIFGAIVGLLMVVTGHFWATILIAAGLGFIGDVLVASGGYRSRPRNILSYAIFQLWIIGPLLPIFYDTAGYGEYISSSMGEEYAQAMLALFTPLNVVILMSAMFLLSLAAAWIGTHILERSLSKAGIL